MMKRAILVIIGFALLLGLCACATAENSTTWQEQYDLGIRYLSEGNYEEAIIAFTTAIEIDSKRAAAYVGRGDAYMLSGKTEENLATAQADYEQAIELDETLMEAYLDLSDVYTLAGNREKALEILQQAFEKIGDREEIRSRLNQILNTKSLIPLDGYPKTERRDHEDGSYDVIEYNAYGNEVKWFSYDTAGNLTYYQEHLYDENQILIERRDERMGEGGYSSCSYFNPDGRCYKDEQYTTLGNWVSSYTYTSENEQVNVSYTDTANGVFLSDFAYYMQDQNNVVLIGITGGVAGINVVGISEYAPIDVWEGSPLYNDTAIQTLLIFIGTDGVIVHQDIVEGGKEYDAIRAFQLA
ncbi:MAG: tetratricopeptide repeat protein [Dorea sp.]|jgi:tetratricopeptide (TPR) repeat protein|nr:tetratricopeptide repeat protein [Dorea sp.]